MRPIWVQMATARTSPSRRRATARGSAPRPGRPSSRTETIFSQLARLAKKSVLVLAHREELLAQAREKIERAIEGSAIVEFDFALLDGARLVLGEAKKGRQLDGANNAERVRDAGKLLHGAVALQADEVCLASAGKWTSTTATEVRQAMGGLDVGDLAITMMENLTQDRATTLRPLS